MTETGWIAALKESIKTQTAAWFVGLLIAILGIFSTHLTESIKFALNKADLRTSQHEKLASEVSAFIFFSELNVEFIEKEWTTKQALAALLTQYNTSVTALRKNEFVYIAWLQKYWGPEEVASFKNLMEEVRAFDSALHSLNDEFEKVSYTEPQIQEKVGVDAAKKALEKMKPAVEKLKTQGESLLLSLS